VLGYSLYRITSYNDLVRISVTDIDFYIASCPDYEHPSKTPKTFNKSSHLKFSVLRLATAVSRRDEEM